MSKGDLDRSFSLLVFQPRRTDHNSAVELAPAD